MLRLLPEGISIAVAREWIDQSDSTTWRLLGDRILYSSLLSVRSGMEVKLLSVFSKRGK
jgi:hypothetical protein